jgi:long-subunit fatty acid transport protein
MTDRARWLCMAGCGWLLATVAPQRAHAGGGEFPAGGTRSLGRGAAALARADDPSVMIDNPALLADLWQDQALLGAHLALLRSCFRPTGAYGVGATPSDDVSNFGDGPIYLEAGEGDTDLRGRPLERYADQPFPRECYDGPAPFLPQLALTVKASDRLGLGLGFFPPDSPRLPQLGRRDGTLDTPRGRRPDPVRYLQSNETVSFFTLLAAAGYRLGPALSIGLGLRWTLLAFDTTQFVAFSQGVNPRNDLRADVFGRDLFVPSATASLQLKPFSALDVAFTASWSDRIRANAKLDTLASAFGTGEVFEYVDASDGRRAVAGAIPTLTPNRRIRVDVPAIWTPKIALGVRFADRLKPLSRDPAAAKRAAGPTVEDAMEDERWDLEADAVYYFASAYDQTRVTARDADVSVRSINVDGTVIESPFYVGTCVDPAVNPAPGTDPCPKHVRAGHTEHGGRNQLSLRAGGDYNPLPGLLALRAGVSYETDGQDVELYSPLQYRLSSVGLHAGFTLRVAHKTDVSVGYAHFIHRDVRLQVNPESRYPRRYKSPEYNFAPGLGEPDISGEHGEERRDFDGIARADLPNGDDIPGPLFINAGSFSSGLDVLSVSFTQHY